MNWALAKTTNMAKMKIVADFISLLYIMFVFNEKIFICFQFNLLY